MHSPKEENLKVVYKILRYLKGTPRREILYRKYTSLSLESYIDADWAGSM